MLYPTLFIRSTTNLSIRKKWFQTSRVGTVSDCLIFHDLIVLLVRFCFRICRRRCIPLRHVLFPDAFPPFPPYYPRNLDRVGTTDGGERVSRVRKAPGVNSESRGRRVRCQNSRSSNRSPPGHPVSLPLGASLQLSRSWCAFIAPSDGGLPH